MPWHPCPAWLAYGLAAALAALFIAHLFPLAFLAGHGAFFEQGDASQHVSGWLFFAQDGWHFPLLRTERLNHPDGVSIAFTDSIPIAALLFKSIVHWLPAQFQYIGLWHGFAFLLQAIAAVFLMRSLGMRHALAAASAAAFALAWPALLWRLGHTALLSHGVLLLALGFYFRGRRGAWRSGSASSALIAISLISLLIHPYLLAFCYALFLAFLTDQALAGESWSRQALRLLASVVIMCIAGVVFGYFGNGTTTFGFDYYSMNLAAPFCGGHFFSCANTHAFSDFHFADATGGQYEGYNYFGAGLLLLLPFAILGNRQSIRALPGRYPALLAVLLLMFVYALSNRIFWGTHLLASYPLPEFLNRLTGTFRSSGRFFWVIGYLVLFMTLAGLLRKPSRGAVVLLAIALPLQWIDVQPLRQRIQLKASAPGKNDLAPWAGLMSGIDKIDLYPAFGCGDADVNIYWFFQRLAAHYGKLLDTGYIARPNVDCAHDRSMFERTLQQGHLSVMPAAYLQNPFMTPAGFHDASALGECAAWQNVVLCQPGPALKRPQEIPLPLQAVAIPGSTVEWSADKLPTQTGKLENGRLVPAEKSRPGFLSFGPYATLPPGRYHYGIRYASHSSGSHTVGSWDIVAGAVNIRSGTLRGTEQRIERIEGTFEMGGSGTPVEIRTFFEGDGDLQVIGIALERIRE